MHPDPRVPLPRDHRRYHRPGDLVPNATSNHADDDGARDLALIERIRGGDADAWAELLSNYQDRLYTICLRMVHDREMARDLTQDAMVKIIQGLDGFDARAKLSTWIIRVTMNVCLSKLRSEKLRRHASLDQMREGGRGGRGGSDSEDGRSRAIVESREPDAESRVGLLEGRALLSKALQGVSDEHRAILILRDARGLDYEQIAEILGVAVGTVKSRLFRARTALRDAIEGLERGESTEA